MPSNEKPKSPGDDEEVLSEVDIDTSDFEEVSPETDDQKVLAEANAKKRAEEEALASVESKKVKLVEKIGNAEYPARPKKPEFFEDKTSGIYIDDEFIAAQEAHEEAIKKFREAEKEYLENVKEGKKPGKEVLKKFHEADREYEEALENYCKVTIERLGAGKMHEKEWSIPYARNRILIWKQSSESNPGRDAIVRACYSDLRNILNKIPEEQRYDEHLEVMIMIWVEDQFDFWGTQTESPVPERAERAKKAIGMLNFLFFEEMYDYIFLKENELALIKWVQKQKKLLYEEEKLLQEEATLLNQEIKFLEEEKELSGDLPEGKEQEIAVKKKILKNAMTVKERISGNLWYLRRFHGKLLGKMAGRGEKEMKKKRSKLEEKFDKDVLADYLRQKLSELPDLDADDIQQFSDNKLLEAFQNEIEKREKEADEKRERLERAKGNIWRFIEDVDLFKKMGGEVFDEKMGLRKIKLNGKYNFIDRNRRVIYPAEPEEWFESIGEFILRKLTRPIPIEEPIAWVKVKGKDFYLTKEGQLLPASMEDIEAGTVKQDVVTEPHLAYVDILIEKLKAFSKRFEMSEQNNFKELISEISKLKNTDAKFDWKYIIEEVKELVNKSKLDMQNKIYLSLELTRTAIAANIDLELNGLSELLKYDWVYLQPYQKGAIIRIHFEDRAVCNLYEEGRFVYPMDEGFDNVDVFVGRVAKVRRGTKYNFIDWEDGRVIERNRWFNKIHNPRNEMFRVERDGKTNFMDAKRAQLISLQDFDEAKDFDDRNRASVKVGEREFSIGEDGAPLDEDFVGVAVREFVERRIQASAPAGSKPHISLSEDIEKEIESDQESQIGYKLHELFEELLKANPKERDKLIKLFGDFKKAINEEASGKRGRVVENIPKMKNELEYLILNSKLGQEISDTLSDFIRSAAENKEISWKNVKPMPISLLMVYEKLLHHPDYREMEAEIMELIASMEVIVQRFYETRQDKFEEFTSRLENEIQNSRLTPDAQGEFLDLLWDAIGNRNIYLSWKKELSVIYAYKPHTTSGKNVQKKFIRLERKGKDIPSELKTTSKEFDRVCGLAKKGKYYQAFEEYKDLLKQYPNLDVKKLADAIYTYFYRCLHKKKEGKNGIDLLSVQRKAIVILEELLKIHPNVPEIRRYLGILRKLSIRRILKRRSKLLTLLGAILALSLICSNPDCSRQKDVVKIAKTIRKAVGNAIDGIEDIINKIKK